jgi:uncharacterized protein
VEITPAAPPGAPVVQSYGDGRFRVAGQALEGSILIFRDKSVPWPVSEWEAVTVDSLAPILEEKPPVDILLVGCGPVFVPAPAGLRAALRDAGIVLEWMDTGAACRTFNVLLGEGRPMAAALIAV